MEINDIKKYFYKENPSANMLSVNREAVEFLCNATSIDRIFYFLVPISELGDQKLYHVTPAKLLIRYLQTDEETLKMFDDE